MRSCLPYCFPDAPQGPRKAKRQETHRKLQRHRKKRLLPLSRYPQIQALTPKPRQKPPIQQLAYHMRTSTIAARAISSEPVSAPTESNAPTPEEDRQAPVLPEKPEKAESPKEEPSVPAITEPEPTPETEPAFDIEHWISYAKSTAVSLGLTLDSSATDCWDNPITAKPTCIYLERDINSRLNRYAKDEDGNRCLDLVRMRRHKQLPDLYRVRISINKSIHRNEHRGSTVLFSCLEGGQNE